MTGATALRSALQSRWNTLAPRERNAVAGALTVVGLALLWWTAISPAWQTLRAAEAQHGQIDGQLQQMRRLQAEALALQGQPKIGYDDALRALETSVRQTLGATAQLSVAGERATLTLKAAQPDALARWLTQARVNARALPAEARLARSPARPQGTGVDSASGPSAAAPTWDGTLVLTLPAR